MIKVQNVTNNMDYNMEMSLPKSSHNLNVSGLDLPRYRVLFSVEDTGLGIKEEDQNKLFKIFGKVGHMDDVNPKGIGLGLTICKKILNQLGGDLKVQSKEG